MTFLQRAILCGAGTLAICLSPSIPALAEDAAQPQELWLQEVVVTAQKRVENVQTVPIAVTVVGGDAFTKANVSGFSDLAKFAPSLTMTAGDQPANSAIVIRGIGTFAFSVAAEPSVLVVVDDVAVGYQAQAFTELVDIDRVEVLNGPQSTLFGKSASAGLVNVTTKAPTDTFTYYGDVKITDDDEQRATLSLSGPLSDTVSFRVSAAARYWGGNVRNLHTGSKIDDDRSGGVRAKLQWRPNDNLNATFTVHFNEDRSECCGVPLVRLDPGAHLFNKAGLPPSVAIPGVVAGANNTSVSIDQAPIANAEDVGFTSHVAYDFGNVTFLAITGLDQYRLHDLTDNDTTSADVLQYFTPFTNTQPAGSSPGSSPLLHGGLLQGGRFTVKTFSQEFRLESNGQHDFNYLLGTYFSDEDLTRNFARGFAANSRTVANWRGETRYDNYALFGQTGWVFLPRTTLITGLRLNREESSYTYDDYYRVIHFPSFGHPTLDVDNVVTGKVGLQFQATDDIMAFAFYAKGYKGVAYDLVTGLGTLEAATFPVKPEKSNDYEAGVRSRWFNRRLVLNATIYDTEYSNFQVQTLVPDVPNTFILTNVPLVRSRGVEFEAVAQVAEPLHVNVGYAYTDARAVTYPIGQCYSGQTVPATCAGSPAFQNLAGAPLPNAPKNKINVGLDYRTPLPVVPLDADLSANTFWQSLENFSITRDPGSIQPSYGITNLNLQLSPQQNRRFSVSLFCNNLFDKHYASNLSNVRGNWSFPAPGTAYAHELPRDFDRYYGIRIAFQSL
jgi:iron complex outermembrane receptor protein